MNQINKNRLIGGSVIAFSALLFAPAILTPEEHNLSNPDLVVTMDNNKPSETQLATTQTTPSDSRTTIDVPIPPAPALKLESAPATSVASTEQEAKKATPVALAKPVTTASKPAAKANTTKSSWLRVGSYSSAKNADKQLKALSKLNYSVKIEQITINGKTYHRVLVGPYNNEETLQKAKKAIIADGHEANIQR